MDKKENSNSECDGELCKAHLQEGPFDQETAHSVLCIWILFQSSRRCHEKRSKTSLSAMSNNGKENRTGWSHPSVAEGSPNLEGDGAGAHGQTSEGHRRSEGHSRSCRHVCETENLPELETRDVVVVHGLQSAAGTR